MGDLNMTPWLLGNLVVPLLLVAAVSYFCGCFNGAVIVSKYILHDDVRTHGSGNAGLTNFYRTFGGPLTLLVILTDVLKAVVAIAIGVLMVHFWSEGLWLREEPVLSLLVVKYWAALFCLLGHMFPCMFGFRGGKGILSGGAIAFMMDWRIGLVVWIGFLLFAVTTRYISLGSVWASVSFPFATWILFHNALLLILALVISALIVWKHRENIQRLLHGTENKFSLHKKKER